MKMKINWEVAVLVFIVGLTMMGFMATIIAACVEKLALAAVFALFTTVLAALAAGLSVGDTNEQKD